MRIYIETYGCSANRADSQIMAGLLTRAGCSIVKNDRVADLIIVNSCAVKGPTEQKLLSRLNFLWEKYPNKNMIVAGCAPEILKEKIRQAALSASLLGPRYVTAIAPAVKKISSGLRVELLGERREIKCGLPKFTENKVTAISPIAEGCDRDCTFCIDRIARGKLISYPPAEIVKDIKAAVRQGAKDVWLCGQDCAQHDNLPRLLEKITNEVKGKYFLRIGMMSPMSISAILDELIEVYKDKHVYKFLHLPLQAGDDKILRAMGRPYTTMRFKMIVKKFRRAIPQLTLWTDAIVGFPSESEGQFQRTMQTVRELRPDFVNVSRFEPRPKTPAAKLPQLATEVKKSRSRKLSLLVEKIALQNNQDWIGEKCAILINERGTKSGQWLGRNASYKPVLIESKKKLLGQFVSVKITDARPTCLIGELCE